MSRVCRDSIIYGMDKDEQLLAAIPDFLSINTLLKAIPAEEGGERFIYFEASNEAIDQHGEKVLASALKDSAEHYLKFGNIDIDHYTILGARMGLANPMAFEIGRPVDVKMQDGRTFVKAQLYTGDGELSKNANMVWESMTQLNPPARWYPSVGGSVLSKSIEIDPVTKEKVAVVKKVRWTNVALSRTPVNQHLPEVGSSPNAIFAKSLGGFVMKSLEAGYGTDSASLSGGSALRTQSLEGRPQSYHEFRDSLADGLKSARIKPVNEASMVAYCTEHLNLSSDAATEWVGRFLSDLSKRLKPRRNP